ncbi:50S ribosomal protein L19 [Candidatus Dependentiae bacterium]|nr:MAG: 50S ribosomal protein L19 [Candidatus Dependentiae bacterium]
MSHGVFDRNFSEFTVGDTIEVAQIVKEGNKERTQLFTGYVIGMHNHGISSTFTVRKFGANNIGVERIFPFYSPIIQDIKLIKQGRVRRAKLYYIRTRIGKSSRIKEKVLTRVQKEALAAKKARKAAAAQ